MIFPRWLLINSFFLVKMLKYYYQFSNFWQKYNGDKKQKRKIKSKQQSDLVQTGTNTTYRAARIGLSQSALTTRRKKQNHGYNERRNPVILSSPMIRSLKFGSTKNSSPKTSKASTNTNITKPEAKHTRINRPSIIQTNSHEAAARQSD